MIKRNNNKLIYIRIAGLSFRFIFVDYKNILYPEGKRVKEYLEEEYKYFITKKSKNIDFTFIFKNYPDLKTINIGKMFYVSTGISNNNSVEIFNQTSIFLAKHFINRVIEKLLIKQNGFIVHASASIIRNKACLFIADSGGGKSTIVKLLSKKYTPYSDDKVIIKKEFNKYYVYQFKSSEKIFYAQKRERKIKLGKIFFIKKSKIVQIKEILDKTDIIKKASRNFFIGEINRSERYKKLFQFITDNKFYSLLFPNDDSVLLLI